MFADKAKAFVAAGVALAASYVGAKWGLSIPDDAQVWIVSGLTALLSGFFTWLVPNKPA